MNKQLEIIRSLIEDGMEKKDRYITLFFSEEGIQVSVYPLTEDGEVSV